MVSEQGSHRVKVRERERDRGRQSESEWERERCKQRQRLDKDKRFGCSMIWSNKSKNSSSKKASGDSQLYLYKSLEAIF